jgi:hypothetical protein
VRTYENTVPDRIEYPTEFHHRQAKTNMQRVRGGLELVRRGRACGAPYARWFAAQPEAAEDDGKIEVLVDGNAVRVPRGVNVLQACEAGGVDIPRYVWILSVGICGLG